MHPGANSTMYYFSLFYLCWGYHISITNVPLLCLTELVKVLMIGQSIFKNTAFTFRYSTIFPNVWLNYQVFRSISYLVSCVYVNCDTNVTYRMFTDHTLNSTGAIQGRIESTHILTEIRYLRLSSQRNATRHKTFTIVCIKSDDFVNHLFICYLIKTYANHHNRSGCLYLSTI